MNKYFIEECICFAVTLVICCVLFYHFFYKKEVKVLEAEKTILIESYLSNIQNYKRPLWSNEKELTEFKKWLRERAEREVK